jgi:hypothetical protein
MKVTECFIPICVLIVMVCVGGTAEAQRLGSSPFNPAPLGSPVQTIVGCGAGYTSHELYDAKITVLETVRGTKASTLIEKEKTIAPPKAGFEYALARIRFEYSARGKPGTCEYDLKEEEFSAATLDGTVFQSASIVPPSPRLQGTLRSGGSLDGWVVFVIPQGDGKTLMTFTAKSGGAVDHGGNVWFQLYQ